MGEMSVHYMVLYELENSVYNIDSYLLVNSQRQASSGGS